VRVREGPSEASGKRGSRLRRTEEDNEWEVTRYPSSKAKVKSAERNGYIEGHTRLTLRRRGCDVRQTRKVAQNKQERERVKSV